MNDDPFIPPKKKINIFWWIGGVFVVLLLLFVFQLFGPSPRIVVSKGTTYITEPLVEGGLPDYEGYVRAKLREGVTPENNAAVLLLKALGPGELSAADFNAIAAEIGLKDIPAGDAVLQSVYSEINRERVRKWLPKPKPVDDGAEVETEVDASAAYTPSGDGRFVWEAADEVIGAAQSAAWTSQQLPPLAEWVEANKSPIDMLVEASRRSRYYSPSPSLLNDKHESLTGMILLSIQANREAARALATRATWHIGENRLNEAWQDNLAIYRLSTLFAQGATLVDQLVAIAIRGIAMRTTLVLLSSDHITKELAQLIQSDLAALPAASNTANCVDQWERIFGLDAVLYVRSHGIGAISQLSGSNDDSSPFSYVSVDWNVVLRKLNQAYDDAADAMRRNNYEERKAAFAQFENELGRSADGVRRPGRLLAAALSRQARSDLVGTIVTSLLLPALTAANSAEDRTNSQLVLVKLAAAISVYRAEHGAYPKNLDDLVPGILPKLPVDLYHAKSFAYRRTENGYIVYTLGENGADDGGSNEQINVFEGRELDGSDPEADEALRAKIPANADDYSIRIPALPFRLPKPPKASSPILDN